MTRSVWLKLPSKPSRHIGLVSRVLRRIFPSLRRSLPEPCAQTVRLDGITGSRYGDQKWDRNPKVRMFRDG